MYAFLKVVFMCFEESINFFIKKFVPLTFSPLPLGCSLVSLMASQPLTSFRHLLTLLKISFNYIYIVVNF